jgi:hypothetical protein
MGQIVVPTARSTNPRSQSGKAVRPLSPTGVKNYFNGKVQWSIALERAAPFRVLPRRDLVH